MKEEMQEVVSQLLASVAEGFEHKAMQSGAHFYSANLSRLFRRFGRNFPVVLIERNAIEANDEAPLELLRKIGTKAQIGERSFLLIVSDATESLEQIENFPKRWILLDKKRAERILATKGTVQSFKTFVRQSLTLPDLSPYDTQFYARDRMFFGRRVQFHQILESSPKNFAIIGPRRIGKSSLARAVEADIRRTRPATIRLSKDRYLAPVAFVDCNLLPNLDDPENSFFEMAIESLGIESRDTYHARKIFGRQLRFATPFEYYERLGREKYTGITLIVDEVDGLLRKDQMSGWRLMQKIQGLVDRLAESDEFVETPGVVFSGFMDLERTLGDNTFPFYGRLREVRLANLSKDATKRLALEPMRELGVKIEEPKDVVNRIVSHTGGMPSVVQSLCSTLISRMYSSESRRLTPALVEEVIADASPLNDYLHWFEFSAKGWEKAIVYFSAGAKRFSRRKFTAFIKSEGFPSVSRDRIDEALTNLEFANIFRAITRLSQYEFCVEAFRRTIDAYLVEESDRVKFLKELVRNDTIG